MTTQFPPPPDQPSVQWSPLPPAPAASRPKPKHWPWIVGIVVAFVLGLTIGSAGGSSSTPSTSPAAAPAAGPGQAFVKDIKSYPGLHTDMSDADLIGLADKVCDAIGTPGITYDSLVATIAATKLGPQVAPILVNAANRSYCPGKTYYVGTAAAYTPPAAPVQEPAVLPSGGPLTSFGSGTYEVGTGDGQVAPGKYKTPGGGTGGSCYWARLKNTDGDFDSIITNGNAEGPVVVTIGKNDGAFETRCTWAKAG